MLIDRLPSSLVVTAVELCRLEKGRRLPLHSVHRWWSRRFAAIYRLLLASFLLDDEDRVFRTLEEPSLMRSRAEGRVFFEPMAGGGTGLAEAALAGWDAYGVDVNPVAVLAARVSVRIAAERLPEGYAEKAAIILREAFDKVEELWRFNQGLVCHIFVSRGRAPTWLSVSRGKRVAFCPSCLAVFEAEGDVAVCPSCSVELKIMMDPIIELPIDLPEEAEGWKTFAVEVRRLSNGGWERSYVSARDPQLREWLSATSARAREMVQLIEDSIKEELSVLEFNRLRRAGITFSHQLFTPRQLASFLAYAEVARKARGAELTLLAAAASDAAKSCTLLAKWYPRLGEMTPAGGVKAHWVPEYTAAANPLAHEPGKLKPLVRGSIASSLRAQLKADSYVQKVGGSSGSRWSIYTGDAYNEAFPTAVDLAVLDPPYGRVKSYASLSAPYFYSTRLFEIVAGTSFTGGVKLKEVEALEATPRSSKFYQVISCIVKKLAACLKDDGRVVLMYNTATLEEWMKMLSTFKDGRLYPRAIYWVLGEAPSGITASRLKGMHLVVFAKAPTERIHMVLREPMLAASRFVKLNVKLEKRASDSLVRALERIWLTRL